MINKKARILLTTLVTILVTLMVLVTGAFIALNIPYVRQRIMLQVTEILSEKLNTRVSMEKAEFSIFGGYIILYGLEIDDQQQREMLQIGKLSANVKLLPLLDQRVVIEKIEVNSLNALLTKKTDSLPANYQFIFDAFMDDKNKNKAANTTLSEKKKLTLNVSHVKLMDIHVTYDKYDCRLRKAMMKEKNTEERNFMVHDFQADWVTNLKKGPMACGASIESLTATQQGKCYDATISGLHYVTDNHRRRKNSGKPRRGFFDTGHLNITANLQMNIDHTNKDSLKFALTTCQAKDSITGIDVRDLRTTGTFMNGKLFLKNLTVQQKTTIVKVANAEMLLPNSTEGRHLSYRTGVVTGKTQLKDISRMFAPVLSKFTLPLNLRLTISGTDNTINFRNVQVFTNDKKLTVVAAGDITHLKEKEQLNVHFNVSKMHAQTGMADQVINQFPVKKMMMSQLHKLGNISYVGDFSVLWKKEAFRGQLHTQVGDIRFNFYLDERNKYVIGEASSKNLNIGHVMDLKKLGNIDASARFSVDISRPRTALMRKKIGGKLPIGTVNAIVNDCAYMGIHVKYIMADIKSDGAIATGDVMKTGKVGDISFSFSFTDTNEMQKMKITQSGLKIHWPWQKDESAKEEKRKAKEEKRKAKEEKRKAKEEKKKAK